METVLVVILFIAGALFFNASHIQSWFLGSGRPTHSHWKVYAVIGASFWLSLLIVVNQPWNLFLFCLVPSCLMILLLLKRRKRTEPMQEIDIEELKAGFKGKPFNQLVQAQLRRHIDSDTCRKAVLGTMEMLPPSAYPLAETFIDRWTERVYEKEFWLLDTSMVFSQVTEDARTLLLEAGAPTDDETLFNMFNIVVMSYAYSATEQPNMRKFIGMRE